MASRTQKVEPNLNVNLEAEDAGEVQDKTFRWNDTGFYHTGDSSIHSPSHA